LKVHVSANQSQELPMADMFFASSRHRNIFFVEGITKIIPAKYDSN